MAVDDTSHPALLLGRSGFEAAHASGVVIAMKTCCLPDACNRLQQQAHQTCEGSLTTDSLFYAGLFGRLQRSMPSKAIVSVTCINHRLTNS